MIKQTCEPDYNKMNESQLRFLLSKHQQMLNNKKLVDALPDKGERFRRSISEIEKHLVQPASPMDCESLINQLNQLSMSSNENETISNRKKTTSDDLSEERLNEVKARLKVRQAQRANTNQVTTTKLITLDEAIRLHEDERRQAEERLIQQTTTRLLGNMSLSNPTTFGLPSSTSNVTTTYRKTTMEENCESDDELGRDRAEIGSVHDSDEVDYPEEENDEESDDDKENEEAEPKLSEN